jgi:hypothetical protein
VQEVLMLKEKREEGIGTEADPAAESPDQLRL